MKKRLSILVIMLSFIMQSFAPMPGVTQVILQPRMDPYFPGTQRPSKSPERNAEPVISAYLTEAADSLLLYSTIVDALSYIIYNEGEEDVQNGNVTFSAQGDAAISLAALAEGLYTISIEADSLVYEGQFEIE